MELETELPTWLSNLNHDLSKLHEAILLYESYLLKIENSAFVANSCDVPKSILFAWYEYRVNTNTLINGTADIVLFLTEISRFLPKGGAYNHALMVFLPLQIYA